MNSVIVGVNLDPINWVRGVNEKNVESHALKEWKINILKIFETIMSFILLS